MHPHPERWNRNLGCVLCLEDGDPLYSHAYELWCGPCLTKSAGHVARIGIEAREMRKGMQVKGAELKRRRAESLKVLRKLAPKIKERDNNTCRECGKQDSTDCTIDHIRPISFGGTDKETNLRILCGLCNSQKNNRPYTNTGFVRMKAEVNSGAIFIDGNGKRREPQESDVYPQRHR